MPKQVPEHKELRPVLDPNTSGNNLQDLRHQKFQKLMIATTDKENLFRS
ncbi:uncharacterized protein METZ01_LOCUS379273, partial [marine metagenome]